MTIQLPTPWETRLLDWATTALETDTPTGADLPAEGAVLDAAYATCAQITRSASKTFYLASGLLPCGKREAARALYAFCRVTDNLVDEADPDKGDPRQALDEWARIALHPYPPTNQPVALAWADARARYNIPVGYAEQLIEGVARDLSKNRYETFDELAAYAYGVASTVGLMAMHIIGFDRDRALPYAVKLGVALQVTNILRDVGEDWAAGRLYLPLDELANFGLSEADIAAGMRGRLQGDRRWCGFMEFQIDRTRRLYEEAMPGIALLHEDGRFAISAAAELYRAILQDIEAHQWDVFSRRAHLSAPNKLRRLPGIWWRSRTMRVVES